MARHLKYLTFLFVIIVFAVLTACAQTPEPTEEPTREPTATEEAAPTTTSIPQEIQKVIVPKEVVVENFIVQKNDQNTDEIEIVLQGYLSNTCTMIDDVMIAQEGSILLVDIQVSLGSVDDCEEQIVQFQETVSVETQDLTPGSYLISSGIVERFDIEAAEAPEEDDEGDQQTAQDGDTTDENPEEPETRDCQDYATFLADVTYPDNTVVAAGETFTKTWEIRNDGECTWGPGYALKGVSGFFSDVAPVEDTFPTVEPSETVELSLVLTAPQTRGTASGAWVIERPEGDNVQIQNGQNFDLWAIVVVNGGEGNLGDEERVRKDGVVCAQANSSYDSELLALINTARSQNGLAAYEEQAQLTEAAWNLTTDMACNDFVSHIDSNGEDWFERIAGLGYLYVDAGENIYFSFSGVPEKAFNWWLDSSVHRGNILNAEFTQIGIGYALNPQTGGSYYTLVFALPEAEE
jgi:uncharacterized protein YkwD